MIRRSSLARKAFILAALVAALYTPGCSRALDTGLDLATRRRAPPSAPKAPAAVTSVYARSPQLEWSARVVGPPSSPGPNLFARVSDGACQSTAQGLSRVLPVAEGLPARSIARVGALGVAVTGLPEGGGGWAVPNGSALAEGMLERTSAQGTRGQRCPPGIFAYLRLGLGKDFEPVSVLR